MLKRPVVLFSVTVLGLLLGLTWIPSLLGFGNILETACQVCDHRFQAFSTSGLLLPIAASSIAGLLLGSLLFWRPEQPLDTAEPAAPDRYCRNCGKGLEPDWSLCPFCGQSAGTTEAETSNLNHL